VNVGQLREALEDLPDDLIIIVNSFSQGRYEFTTLERIAVSGLETRYSFEWVNCLELSNGSASAMRKNGLDVVAHIPYDFENKAVHFETCVSCEKIKKPKEKPCPHCGFPDTEFVGVREE